MALVIKRQISLDVLGDEFKGFNPTFSVIKVSEIPKINKRISDLGDDSDKLLELFLEIISEHFIEDEKLKKEDLDSLGMDAVIHCFRLLTGQEPDPKVQTPSSKLSTTEAIT